MQDSDLGQIILWLSTAGLSVGVGGAFGLAFLTRVFITIQPNGDQYWGPGDMPIEQWRRRNIGLRKIQKYGVPASYIGIALGFLAQLLALWLPDASGAF